MAERQPEDTQSYRCARCGYVVTVQKEVKAPEYCPNCAVTHLLGKMEPMGKS